VSESTADKAKSSTAPDPEPVLGLRENLAQFSLLVLVNAFVGGWIVADLRGIAWAIAVIAGLTFASGTIVALRMSETLKRG
jgi:hypothetical protein